MRALAYFFAEAAESLWRSRRAALLSVLTIAGGLFVLGFFLALNANLQRVVERWTASAEMSVYVKDDANAEQLKAVDEMIAKSGLAAQHEYVSKEQAASRFRQDFPDLAPTADRPIAKRAPRSRDRPRRSMGCARSRSARRPIRASFITAARMTPQASSC